MLLGLERVHGDKVRDPSRWRTDGHASGVGQVETRPSFRGRSSTSSTTCTPCAGMGDYTRSHGSTTATTTAMGGTIAISDSPGPPPPQPQRPQPQPQPQPPPHPPPEATRTPRAEAKPAPKAMPGREVPKTDYVNAEKPMLVAPYIKVLHDYAGTPVRSRLNLGLCTRMFTMSMYRDRWPMEFRRSGDSICDERQYTHVCVSS